VESAIGCSWKQIVKDPFRKQELAAAGEVV
jgi:hypothetical protein